MLTLLKPTDHQGLRAFSVTMMWVFPVVFMFLLPWIFATRIPWWPAMLSGFLAVLYFIYPKGLYVPYRMWMAIASVLGWVNTRLILGLAFYLLIVPIGLVLRVFKKLQYQQGSANPNSNWVVSEPRNDSNKLKDPF